MAHHLLITVRFFASQYYGKSWPPAPATVFQALVSGGNTGAAGLDWGPSQTDALQWLERLAPPSIAARQTENAKPYRLFVPNNNMDKAVQSEVSGSKNIVKQSDLRTVKDVFPKSITGHSPGESCVIYSWPIPDSELAAAQTHTPAIDLLTARLTSLGWGVDFAAAHAEFKPDTEHHAPSPGWSQYVPASNGSLLLQVPAPGLLHTLGLRFAAFRGRITSEGLNPTLPPAGWIEVHYRPTTELPVRTVLKFELYKNEEDRLTVAWSKSMHVSGWLRHAAKVALEQEQYPQEWINQFICGHTGPDSLGHRLSYLPLPSIGARHTDGIVRRTVIVAPAEINATEAQALDILRLKLSGAPIIGEEKPEPLGYFAEVANPQTVFPFYLGQSAVWESVTPVILQGHNTLRRQISIEKTQRLLLQSLAAAGYPAGQIADLSFQPAPFWSGSEAAGKIFVPAHLERWPRLHVRVVFTQPVPGPVVIGLGRHYGIGLFAAPAANR